ncbi:hypothetical protein AK812_SmicGene44087 [Symbiodinium microadriaticum]|uniref:Uncharacterized protein n=1 Tax=Symbiodinium microadriaticum TaxID=2951 RepID=A0A1Q9BZM6_SYMMI|nr:hypothetical protein AK812_SmicGene44087 [Symbiodinium microadriaticum]CAE6962010.1 unnamed protein product [Symbiodinium sp. KB8]
MSSTVWNICLRLALFLGRSVLEAEVASSREPSLTEELQEAVEIQLQPCPDDLGFVGSARAGGQEGSSGQVVCSDVAASLRRSNEKLMEDAGAGWNVSSMHKDIAVRVVLKLAFFESKKGRRDAWLGFVDAGRKLITFGHVDGQWANSFLISELNMSLDPVLMIRDVAEDRGQCPGLLVLTQAINALAAVVVAAAAVESLSAAHRSPGCASVWAAPTVRMSAMAGLSTAMGGRTRPGVAWKSWIAAGLVCENGDGYLGHDGGVGMECVGSFFWGFCGSER